MREILELYITLFIAFQSPEIVREKQNMLHAKSAFLVRELTRDHLAKVGHDTSSASQAKSTHRSNSVEKLNIEFGYGAIDAKDTAKSGKYNNLANLHFKDLGIDFAKKDNVVAKSDVEKSPILVDMEGGGEVSGSGNVASGKGVMPEVVSDSQAAAEVNVSPEIAAITLEDDSKKKSSEENIQVSKSDVGVIDSLVKDGEEGLRGETDLFSLDKAEFKIEDISDQDAKSKGVSTKVIKGKSPATVEVVKKVGAKIAQKESKNKETNVADKSDAKGYEIVSDIKGRLVGDTDDSKKDVSDVKEGAKTHVKVEVPSLTPEEKEEAELIKRFAKLVTTIVPKEKSYDQYNSQVLSAKISKKIYDQYNQHLDAVTYVEEYYQMLFVAIKQGDVDAVNALTSHLGIVKNVTIGMQTPIVYAITNHQLEVIKLMLRLGYNPNQRDGAYNTPLHVAVKENRIDYVTELLKYGANPSLPDSELKLPVTMALEQDNLKLAKLLQKAGAEYGQVTREFDMVMGVRK